MTKTRKSKVTKKVDLIKEKEDLEREQPILKKGFFEFIESFRKYKEMRKQVVGDGRKAAAKANW